MRVLHVSEAHVGGVVSVLQEFTRYQAAAGHDVHLLVPPQFPPRAVGTRHGWSIDRERLATAVPASRELAATVRRVRPDVVHLHSFVAGVLGRLPRLIRGVPVVYQPHAWSFEFYSGRIRPAAMRMWERWAARRVDVLVANCDDEIAEGAVMGIDRPAVTLGLALDLEHFRVPTHTERATARAALGRDGRRMLVVLGRLARQKGQDLLLREWERRPLPDTDLVLVGPGDAGSLREHAPVQWGRSVHAIGSTDDVRSWLWAGDLLLLPSRYETVSLAVGEAMACGLPVVATDVNGAAEAVVGGPLPAGGEIVAVGDMAHLLDRARRTT